MSIALLLALPKTSSYKQSPANWNLHILDSNILCCRRNPSMPEQLARPSLVHWRLKPRRTRVKTGCLPCRLRRKKCDELKPICSGCKRNHLICSLKPESQNQATSCDKEYQSSLSPNYLAQEMTSKTVSSSEKSESDEIGLRFKQSYMPHQPKCEQGVIPLTTPDQLHFSALFGSLNLRHPASRILLEHYVHKTANLLSITRGPQNPFITCVMPLALADPMIMDSILALSGSHLCHTVPGADLTSTSLIHYNLALNQLKYKLTRIDAGNPADPVRLLLTILVLSITEVSILLSSQTVANSRMYLMLLQSVSGNSKGAIFHHLRASSHFVPLVLALDPTHGDQEVSAFLLETYAYMVSIVNITVNTQPAFPSLVLDPYIASLERFKGCKSFGTMFGYARDLLSLVPTICTLGYNRILEESAGECSSESLACYKAIRSKIENWQEPSTRENSGIYTKDLTNAAKVYKEAVLIFLHTAFYASNVTDPELLALVDKSICESLVFADFDTDSPVLTVMLWPCMIIGSCLRQPVQREYLRYKMLETPFNKTVIRSSVQLLDWLWEDSASDAFGPYGLGSVMRKYGVIHSMS